MQTVDGSRRIATRAEVEAVFHSHAGRVWRAVLAMSAGRTAVADDATAEAFARLFAHRESVREPVPWVFRMAFRLAGQELRRDRVIAPEGSAEPMAERRSALPSDLTDALRRLSPDQRVVVFLHYYADLPVAEGARLVGSPAATVKVRLHRARRSLRASLETVGVHDG
jgi:RNA polymerase sigma-70 factor (ECF subfamily)